MKSNFRFWMISWSTENAIFCYLKIALRLDTSSTKDHKTNGRKSYSLVKSHEPISHFIREGLPSLSTAFNAYTETGNKFTFFRLPWEGLSINRPEFFHQDRGWPEKLQFLRLKKRVQIGVLQIKQTKKSILNQTQVRFFYKFNYSLSQIVSLESNWDKNYIYVTYFKSEQFLKW